MAKRRLLLNENQINLSNLKWVQNVQSSIIGLGSNLITPNFGSLTFTPSEMAEGSYYRIILHYKDGDFLTAPSELMATFNGINLYPSNFFTFSSSFNSIIGYIRFESYGASIYLQGSGGSDPTIPLVQTIEMYPIFDRTINQTFNFKLASTWDGVITLYSSCEIIS